MDPSPGEAGHIRPATPAERADIPAMHAANRVAWDEAAERYERWRRFDNLSLLAVTDVLNRLFSNDLPPLRLTARLTLDQFNELYVAPRCGFVVVPAVHQGEQRKSRVTEPAKAVVPVVTSADAFRQ